MLGNNNNNNSGILLPFLFSYFPYFYNTRMHNRGFAVAYINNDYTRENNIVVIPILNRHASVNLSCGSPSAHSIELY